MKARFMYGDSRRLMRDEKLRRYFKALGDKTRFDVVQELSHLGESSVTDLSVMLGITQPLMSWHVRTLRNAGIVVTRRHGRQVFCSLDRQNIAALQARFNALVSGLAPITEPAAAHKVPLPG